MSILYLLDKGQVAVFGPCPTNLHGALPCIVVHVLSSLVLAVIVCLPFF